MNARQPGKTTRSTLFAVALIPVAGLAIASQLEPSVSGLGTHQQLGLPPCSLRMMAGIRCPGCGMTTSWAYFVRGQWQASMSVNFGGFLLAFAGLAASTLLAQSALTGNLPSEKTQRWMMIVLIGIATVAIVDWLRRLAIG